MSENEEALAIARLVQDAANSKRRVALLKSNLESFNDALKRVNGQLSGILQSLATYQDILDNINDLPTAEQVRDTYLEYVDETARYKELSERIKSLGI